MIIFFLILSLVAVGAAVGASLFLHRYQEKILLFSFVALYGFLYSFEFHLSAVVFAFLTTILVFFIEKARVDHKSFSKKNLVQAIVASIVTMGTLLYFFSFRRSIEVSESFKSNRTISQNFLANITDGSTLFIVGAVQYYGLVLALIIIVCLFAFLLIKEVKKID